MDLDSFDSIYATSAARYAGRRTAERSTTTRTSDSDVLDLAEGSHCGFVKHRTFGEISLVAFSDIVRELDSAIDTLIGGGAVVGNR